MKEDFYVTLPSNSSLTDYPNNSSNNFKVRLPTPLRLQGDWKVALASISVPDPQNTLPNWLTDSLPLVYMTWNNADTNHLNKHYLEASFLLRDINEHVDINMLTGAEFLKNVFHYFKKKIYVKDGKANRQYGNTDTEKTYYPEMRVEGEDVILDSSKVEKHDFGRGHDTTPLGWMAPSFAVNKQLAFQMGWFVENYNSNPQVAIRLGPNLVMEPHGYLKPFTTDIKTRWNGNGEDVSSLYKSAYWIIPRDSNGKLTDYIRLSLDVNWRFTNLNYAFEHVFGNTSRSLFVYSDVRGSSVLGDQITDFIREVNYKRQGKGSYYFEPTHLQYIPLRKQLLDIIQIQIAEATGALTTFGRGITTVTFHFKQV